ncbi:MAG: polysaccharide biosynthesis C-terminal domain-containing protein [Lactobacillus sp.]|jgi:O-antigen/teichoic acid export membrane protein|nr:polysaccharide biosynthesis C-terminal domain-containing protein [Lactobacillus sp.]
MKVLKNYLWNAFYQIFLVIVPVITLPYVNRTIGATNNGIFAYTNSNVQYFILIGSLGVAFYGNREIAYLRHDREATTNAFWSIFFMRLAAMTVAMVAFIGFLAFTGDLRPYYIGQGVAIIAAMFDISYLFMGFENFKVTVLRNFVIKILSLVLIFTLVKTKSDLLIYILIIAGSTLLGNLTLWPYLKRYVDGINWHALTFKKHFLESLSLLIPQLATQIYVPLNKTMLGAMISYKSSGFYYNADNITKILLSVVTAIATVMLPHVANAYAAGDKADVNKYLYLAFHFVSILAVPLAFGLAAIAPKFVVLYLGKPFAEVGTLMVIEAAVVVLIAWSNVIGIQYLLATHQNSKFTTSVVLGAILNIVLNIPLIIMWQANGAMLATVLAEVVVTGYQVLAIAKQVDLKQMFNDQWKYFLGGILLFLAVRGLHDHWQMTIKNLVIEVAAGVVVYGLAILILRPKVLKQATRFLHKRGEA